MTTLDIKPYPQNAKLHPKNQVELIYGMEMDPTFVDVIVQRYCDYTGNTEVIKNGEKITWNQ
jgi:hypothetical protein